MALSLLILLSHCLDLTAPLPTPPPVRTQHHGWLRLIICTASPAQIFLSLSFSTAVLLSLSIGEVIAKVPMHMFLYVTIGEVIAKVPMHMFLSVTIGEVIAKVPMHMFLSVTIGEVIAKVPMHMFLSVTIGEVIAKVPMHMFFACYNR